MPLQVTFFGLFMVLVYFIWSIYGYSVMLLDPNENGSSRIYTKNLVAEFYSGKRVVYP